MKRRVNQHFSSSGKKQLRIQLETDSISVEETGSELIALLKELDEIKLHKHPISVHTQILTNDELFCH